MNDLKAVQLLKLLSLVSTVKGINDAVPKVLSFTRSHTDSRSVPVTIKALHKQSRMHDRQNRQLLPEFGMSNSDLAVDYRLGECMLRRCTDRQTRYLVLTACHEPFRYSIIAQGIHHQVSHLHIEHRP